MGRLTKFNDSVDKFGDGLLNWFRAKTGQELSNAQLQANAFNAAEAQKARDFNLQMYQDYESPKAMMEQYRQAGLNPALMYEGYTPPAVSSNATASSVAPTSETNILTDGIQAILGMVSAKQQIDLQRAQIRSINADTEGKQIDNSNKQRMYDIEYSLKDVNIKEAQSEIEKNAAEVNKITQDIKESASRISVNNKELEIGDAKIELMGSEQELNETKQIVEKLNAQTIAAMLPYVKKVQEANIALTEAKTAAEINSAEKLMYEANESMLRGMAEAELIGEGYYKEKALLQKRERKALTANAVVGNTCRVIDSVCNGTSNIINSLQPLRILNSVKTTTTPKGTYTSTTENTYSR